MFLLYVFLLGEIKTNLYIPWHSQPLRGGI